MILKETDYSSSQINIREAISKFENINDYLPTFLCKDTIKNVEKFVKNTLDFQKKASDVKDLWKGLLIDSISTLKINDIREKINGSGTNQTSINEKFETVGLLNSYGIDELDKYFDDFVEFESVLYGSDSHYRDHVNHVIHVWLIGMVLLCREANFKQMQFSKGFYFVDKPYSFAVRNKKDFKVIKENKVSFYITTSELFSMWTIIALCHDLGYPLEKASNINQNLKNILGHFGSLNIQEFSFNFNILNNHLVEKYLNIVSSKITTIIENKNDFENNFYRKNKNVDKVGYTSIQSKYRDKIAKSLEDYRHGVLSGLLIYKTLTYFLETDYSYPNNCPLPYEDLRQFEIRKEILRAITGHTCPKLYHLDIRNFSFLLILCDELHEWDRPKFEDFKNGPLGGNDQKVDVFVDQFYFNSEKIKEVEKDKKFKAVVRIRFEDSSKTLSKDPINTERKIDKKFQTLHHLLRSAKDDKKREFLFRWKYVYRDMRKGKKISYAYRFRFDSSLDVFESISASAYYITEKKNRVYPIEPTYNIYRKITKISDTSKKKLDLRFDEK